MKKILIAEDEIHVVAFIKKGLTEEGFEVSVALDGKSCLKMLSENKFDLLILDIMLPEVNGIDICREVRKTNKHLPILFLTALGTAENIVLGLESGADDYLVKPFKFIEFVARVKTLLRRTENFSTLPFIETSQEHIYTANNLELDDHSKIVKRAGKNITLTSTEYKLLLYFLRNKNKVLSRLDILEDVWGINFDMGTNVVDVYVNYLRKKIDSNFEHRLINTVIGMGYVLKD